MSVWSTARIYSATRMDAQTAKEHTASMFLLSIVVDSKSVMTIYKQKTYISFSGKKMNNRTNNKLPVA